MRATEAIRRSLILSLIVLLVSSMLPHAAASTPTGEHGLPGLFGLRTANALMEVGEEEPGRGTTLEERVETAYDEHGRLVDPTPMVDLALERMRLAFGNDAVPIGAFDHGAGVHATGAFRIGLPAGDLDGDGRAEVLVYTYDIETYVLTLEAVDGGDASLWNRTFDLIAEGLYLIIPILPGDLDGDGGDDVLLWTLRITDEKGRSACVPFAACATTAEIDAAWGLQGLDGNDATFLFDLHHPAFASVVTIDDATFVFSSTYASVIQIDNNIVYPVPLGDLDGDGGLDLLVVQDDLEQVLVDHYAYSFGPVSFAYFRSVSVDSRASLVRGADGSTVADYAIVEDALDDPYIIALGDASDDGIDDLAVLTSEGDNAFGIACATVWTNPCAATPGHSAYILSVRSAHDGSTHWSEDAVDTWSIVLPGDVDGDGANDIAVASDDLLTTLSGATGNEIFSTSFPDIDLLIAPGDVDGDGLGDLLVADVRFVDGTRTLVLTGVSGTDGTVLYTTGTEIVGPLYVVDAGDQDGDGATDLFLVMTIHLHQKVGLHAITSADGSSLWSQTHDGFAWVVDGGDLDGDGDHDAAMTLVTGISDGREWNFTGRDESGGDLGSRTLSLIEDSEAIVIGAGGSFSDDGTDDLVISAIEVIETHVVSAVEGIDVTSGVTFFTRGDTLLSPDGLD